MSRPIPSLLLAGALLFIPWLAGLEHADRRLWQSRLAINELEPEPDRHTFQFFNGTYLPARITGDLTLGPDVSPIILTGSVTIEKTGHLRLLPNTALYANEFATLIVKGRLSAQGAPNQTILLTTNEEHPINQVWNGLILEPGSQASLSHLVLRHGAPAITCEAQSELAASQLKIEATVLGIYSESSACRISDSRIHSYRTGVQSRPENISLNNVIIHAYKEAIGNPRTLLDPST